MASKDLAIKFSNEVYANKKDVANFMKIANVDQIWNTVLEYRENFMFELNLKHITGSNYSVCLTPHINERINSIERKLMRINMNYFKLTMNKTDVIYKREAYSKILTDFALKFNLILEEYEMQKILNGSTDNLRPELMLVSHYYDALKSMEKNYSREISINTFSNFVKILQSVDVAPFRIGEVQNSYSKSLINRIYIGLPANAISSSMNNLIEFLNDSNYGMLLKACAALYYLYYVRPYDVYSEDLALYIFKNVLANNGIDEVASTIFFERILDDKEEFEKIFIESQRSLDLTYLLDYVLKIAEKVVDETNIMINESKSKAIASEIFQEETTKTSEDSLVPNLDELEKEFVADASKFDQSSSKDLNFSKNIAIETVPTGLAESEATKLEQHLLEMNPNLSRGQAYFYARHCTIGMSYTIAQYKKEVGCAYETARSSMDNLVYLGYYRKELLKNKFIYIPIKKR